MLRFMDGFDQLKDISAAGSPSPLAAVMNRSGYTVSGAVGLDIGRTQDQTALLIAPSPVGSVKRVFTSSALKVVIGFAYLATSKRSNIITIPGVGTLAWDETTGKLQIANGVGTATILLGLWYYFEIIVDRGNSLLTVYVNNGKDIEVALPSSAANLTTYDCTWTTVAEDSKKLDDLYFVDSAAGRYTDRMGPMSIIARLPTSDVDKEWSPSTGTDHWPLVSNQPPDEDEYVQSNTSGAVDTYLSNQGLPANSSVLAVGVTVLSKKSDIDARQLGLVVGKKGDAQTEVVDTQLSVDPKYSYAVFENAPGGAAWTDPSVTSVAFGVVVRP